MAVAPLPVRRVQFTYPDDFDPMWAPRLPEFAAAANAISLGMPYAEPLFIKAMRSTFNEVDDELRARTITYIKQETGHYTQHKRFNEILTARYPATVRLQRWIEVSTNWVSRRSYKFRVAFAAGGETISYGIARWTEKHVARLMDGAEPVAATLYMWHLAEEIEHKSSTYDVFEAVDGSKIRYSVALLAGFVSICVFTTIGALMQLWYEHRLRNPFTWFRLVKLAFSVGFVLLPTLVASVVPGHHPRQFADPTLLPMWLRQYDPETDTMPLWGPAVPGPSQVRVA